MKYGDKIYTYRDIEEAKKLIGKKVLASDFLENIEEHQIGMTGCLLTGIFPLEKHPFSVDTQFSSTSYQFIREVIEDEPQYRPFTCEEARKHIGEVVRRDRDVNGTNCSQYNIIHSVVQESAKKLSINGVMAEDFVKNWKFDDTNKPCGVEVEE